MVLRRLDAAEWIRDPKGADKATLPPDRVGLDPQPSRRLGADRRESRRRVEEPVPGAFVPLVVISLRRERAAVNPRLPRALSLHDARVVRNGGPACYGHNED